MNALHREAIVIDGLIISKWDRSVFEDMKKGGISAANCTVSVWEDFNGTVRNIAQMKRLIRENADLLTGAAGSARPGRGRSLQGSGQPHHVVNV